MPETRTMQFITWENALMRTDLIGGDIESFEDGIRFRGPLSEIKVAPDYLRFISPWCAFLNRNDEWEKFDYSTKGVNPTVVLPVDMGDGRVRFELPCIGFCTMFPKSANKLDPTKVKGLPKASERLLALYPDLPFDHDTVRKFLTDKGWLRLAKDFHNFRPDQKLTDLLARFNSDSSVEEFLWHYIGAMTGERYVHLRVY